MADASCNTFPTLTATQVSTSESLVTTFTESVSTGFGFVSTSVISTCVFVDPTSPCLPTVSSSFITVPGDPTTVTVPATVTVSVPVTVLNTLYGTFCSSTSISSSDNFFTPTPTPPFIPSSTPPPFSPSPTPTDSSSSTATVIPVVDTTPPTANSFVSSDYLSSTPSQSPTTIPAESTGTPSNNNRIAIGPVVGGVVGGLAVLLLFGLLAWRMVKKRKRQSKLDLFFSRDEGRHDYHRKGSIIEKPSYQYGVVGQPNSILANAGGQNTFGNGSGTGQAQGLPQSTSDQAVVGNGGGLGHANGQTSVQVGGSLANGGGMGQASGPPGALGTNGASHGVISNIPPVVYTGDPSLVPLIQRRLTIEGSSSGLLAAAPTSRFSPSPSSRPSSSGTSSQVLGPLVTSTRQSWITNNGYAQAHSGPSNLQKNNGSKLSISSVASTSSAYSNSSWVGDPSTKPVTDDNGKNVPPVLPSMEASSHQQQEPRRDSFGRVLTVRQVINNADNEYRPYSGSSSMGGVRASQEVPLYDERGRPLNMPPEKAPLVHLDGALYQDQRRSGYEPPAYIE